jgi:hypothetical protein
MWWGIGIFGWLIWLSLLIVLGVTTLRNGHTALFWFGIIFPVLWIIGFFMAPTAKAVARGA